MNQHKPLGLKVTRKVKTHENVELTVPNEVMIAALQHLGISIPNDAKLVMKVPSGGDYSGTEISETVTARWTEVSDELIEKELF
jgi:hypothetical protein